MQGFTGGSRQSGAVMAAPFGVFFVCWILLCIASWVFYAKASYQTKKAAQPFIAIGTGVVFFGFAEWVVGGKLPWVFALVIVLIIFFNIRNTLFCPRCNATLYARGFYRPEFCWKCGAQLS